MRKIKNVMMCFACALAVYSCATANGESEILSNEQRDFIASNWGGYSAEYDSLDVSYPTFYAGAGVISETDKTIYVNLTEDTQDIRDEIESIFEGYSIEFRQATYSLDELEKTFSYLSARDDELREKYLNDTVAETSAEYKLLNDIMGMGMNTEENCVQVEIHDITDEKIQLFKEMFPEISDAVIFENHIGVDIAV